MPSLPTDFAESVRLLVCREVLRKPCLARRFSGSEVAQVFEIPASLLEPHDPDDTTTRPAPGAIQIGPLDVP